ncbi:hypothetical protein [Thermoflexus sp.]|uniref:hypothetical protein n=1 Tax=Thermoflexus sp. TaxID=1969742 RepID=UPI002ADE2A3D|nr:hypothetical protein [Thermoflexus sp.]
MSNFLGKNRYVVVLVLLVLLAGSCLLIRPAGRTSPLALPSPLLSPASETGRVIGTLVVMDPRATPLADGVFLVELPKEAQVFVVPTIDVNAARRAHSFDKTTGRFEFSDLLPGRYHLLVSTISGVLPARSMETGELIFIELRPGALLDLKTVQVP